jgi:hypothetical protein
MDKNPKQQDNYGCDPIPLLKIPPLMVGAQSLIRNIFHLNQGLYLSLFDVYVYVGKISIMSTFMMTTMMIMIIMVATLRYYIVIIFLIGH